jgi:GNAT superfamily N-acetyltransferase
MSDSSQDQGEEALRMAELVKYCESRDERVLATHPGPLPAVVTVEDFDLGFNICVWAYTSPETAYRVMMMVAQWRTKDEVQLCDIRSDDEHNDKGYGSQAMPCFLKHAKDRGASRVTGRITRRDWDHIHRLVHFYRKHGFTVDLLEDMNQPEPTQHPVGTLSCTL